MKKRAQKSAVSLSSARADALATKATVDKCFEIFKDSSQKCVSELPTTRLSYVQVRASLVSVVKQLAYEATKFALVMKGDTGTLDRKSSEQMCAAFGSAAQKVATVSLLVGACGGCDALRKASSSMASRALRSASNLLESVGTDDAKVRYQ